jgi:spore germination protein YaaH
MINLVNLSTLIFTALKLKLTIILSFILISYASHVRAQTFLDTTYTLPSDTIKIENFSKKFLGQATDINDATEKVQKSLVGKVVKLFKFSSNFKAAEKKRIIDVFSSLGIEDSIKLSESKIKLLILQLSKRENQHYDTLLKLISSLKENHPVLAPATPEEVITEEPSNNVAVKDKDVDDLTTKILSIVTKKATESEEDKKKNEKLSEIRKINARRDNVQFIVDSAKDIVRKFVVRTFNKVKVVGFYNSNQNQSSKELNLSNYNNIIYNGIFVDNNSGHIKNLNGWDTAEILNVLDNKNKGLQNFEKKKIKPILNLIFPKRANFSGFLLNQTSQQNLISDLKYILPFHESAEGICLQLDDVDIYNKKNTTEFIAKLSVELKKINKNYKLFLIVPSAGNNSHLEFNLINPYVDYFIIDFYSIPNNPEPLPLAPIKGKELNSIESTISFYINNNEVSANKLILGLSYQGLKWSFNKQNQQYRYIQPLTYAEIRSNYNWPITYNDQMGTAYMDSLDSKGDLKRRIYLEDENTLAKKYDFVLQNDLAGVSLYASNFDKGYGELNDMLVYKLAIIDTLYIEDSVISRKKEAGFFEKIGMRLYLYYYVLNHPCMVCFDNVQEPEERAKIFHAVSGLKWDEEAEKEKKSRFLNVTNHLFRGALQVLSVFLILAIVLGFMYYRKITFQGGGGKTIYILCLINGFVLILCIVLLLFTINSKSFSFFGVYNKKDNVTTINSNVGEPVPVGSQDSTLSSKTDTTKAEIANGGSAQVSTNVEQTAPRNSSNSTSNQIQTNTERTAANDFNKGIKNKYLNSSLRIAQNSYFRNKNKKQNNPSPPSANQQVKQTPTNKEPEIVSSSFMTKREFVDYKNDTYCIDELETNSSGCVNIPFNTLFVVIVIAIIIGILFDILAIRRIVEKNEIP